MKSFASFVVVLLFVGAPAVRADTFVIVRAKVALSVTYETLDGAGERVLATTTLDGDDLVNLALGRPRSTKLDKDTEVLCFAANATTPGAGTQLVVFDPSQESVTATILTAGDFTLLSDEDFGKNVAFSLGAITPTALGDPELDALLPSTLALAGKGTSSGKFASTSVAGPLSFRFTDDGETTDIAGVVTKGRLKTVGKQLALLID